MITYLLVDPPNPSQYNICREYQGNFKLNKNKKFDHNIFIICFFFIESSLDPSNHKSNVRLSQHVIQPSGYRPNVVMAENQKKSYNYMASPNYLQYENTYQKYKNICHNKDVTNFRESNEQRMHEYRNQDEMDNRFTDTEVKAENTMQSSDDEGGFRQNILFNKNQFNHINGLNSNNGINGNMGYNFKEVEPLLHGRDPIQITNSRQKYEPPHYANPGAMIPMRNIQKSMEQQNINHSHGNRFNQNQQQYQNGSSPYRKVPPIPSLQPYTKPLPKLPTHIGGYSCIILVFWSKTILNCIFHFYVNQMRVLNHQLKILVDLIRRVLAHQMKIF